MSARASRSDQPPAKQFEWLEFSDQVEISAESVWVPDYEEEITLQSKRVVNKTLEQSTGGRVGESSQTEASPRAPIIDELQVLAGEASFATVVLNQQIEPTTVKRRKPLTAGNVERSSVNKAHPRARILDESEALPAEASFATVRLNQRVTAHTYSPMTEFFTKSNL